MARLAAARAGLALHGGRAWRTRRCGVGGGRGLGGGGGSGTWCGFACRGQRDVDCVMEGRGVSLSQKLWEGCRKEAALALYSPFVLALAAGKLEKGAFQGYIAQDVFFLAAFSKAYGLAEENVDDLEAKDWIQGLQRAVDSELEMHSSYAQGWGLSMEETRIVPNVVTSAYTEFLLATAAGHASDVGGGDGELGFSSPVEKGRLAAFTIAAMTPCMRLYAFLGKEIRDSVTAGGQENIYRDWIEAYSSDSFQSAAVRIEQLLDRLATVCTGQDYEAMERFYRRAMVLEVAFFNAQPVCEGLLGAPYLKAASAESAAHHQCILVSDFDSTCTVADSCPILAELTISAAEVAESEGLRSKWNDLIQQYAKQLQELMDKILASRQGLETNYDYDDVRSALDLLSELEVKANARVVDSRVLRGLKLRDVHEAGRRMPLRPGCQGFLQRVREDNQVALHILSVCWSQSFLEGALQQQGVDSARIYCNDLQASDHVSDGTLISQVQHALDKERILDQIVHAARPSSASSNELSVVYVGDSVTDLLCLLKADVGIVLGDSSTLHRFASAFGVKIRPLLSSALRRETGIGEVDEKTIFNARDWHEVQAFLWGD